MLIVLVSAITAGEERSRVPALPARGGASTIDYSRLSEPPARAPTGSFVLLQTTSRPRTRGCRIHAAPPRGGHGESPHPPSLSLSRCLPTSLSLFSAAPSATAPPPTVDKDGGRRSEGAQNSDWGGQIGWASRLSRADYLKGNKIRARREGEVSCVPQNWWVTTVRFVHNRVHVALH